MVDMVGNNVNLGDKVIYSSRSSKKLVIGYLLKILGPKKGVVDKNPDGLKIWIQSQEERNKRMEEIHPGDSSWQVDPARSYCGDKIVTSDQIFKIM